MNLYAKISKKLEKKNFLKESKENRKYKDKKIYDIKIQIYHDI